MYKWYNIATLLHNNLYPGRLVGEGHKIHNTICSVYFYMPWVWSKKEDLSKQGAHGPHCSPEKPGQIN